MKRLVFMGAILFTVFSGGRAGFCEEGAVDDALRLSPEERSFLSSHAPISVGTMSNWPPLDYVDEGGRPAGIGFDYLRALNGLLGNVLVAEPAPFSENYEKVREGRLDALMDITPRVDREPFFEFTKPYLSIPHVIIARKDGLYFSSEETLKGKTVALEKGYYNVVVFRENFPDVQIREYGSTSDALDAVARGEVDAYAGNRAVAIYLIEKELLGNLQPQGRLKMPPIDLAIGVRKDWPILAAILDKALMAIPASEREKINARYVSSVYEPWFASRHFWTVVAASLGVVILVGLLGMLWTRTLKRMVEVRTREFIREHRERLRAEESLGESERRYLTLFENAGDAIFLMSEDRFVDCNARTLALFGCEREEIIGASPYSFSPALQSDGRASKESALEKINRALTEGAQFFEWVHCRKDGATFDAEVMLNRLEMGHEVFIQAIVRDVTERKRAERELKRLNDQLDQRVKERTAELEAANKELEAFSYSVSHDLRAPLRAIDGFSRILEEDEAPRLGEQGKHVIAVIRENTLRMGALIDDLLAFSRMGRQQMALGPVDMKALVSEVWEELSPARGGREIDLSLGEIPPAKGDRAMLKQVFVNLLSNAVKFTRSRKRAIIEVVGRVAEEKNEYTVKDNGVGFDMRYVGKLFGVFQRLHRADEFEGTGVGLALLQRIVHRHGGDVGATSVLGEGAAFTITLPRHDAGERRGS